MKTTDFTGFEELFNRTVEYRDCVLQEYEKGHVVVKTVVNETDTNPYGMAHGGYLYTLCDNLAGILGYSLGSYTVSQQVSISYIASAKNGDELTLTGTCLHDGRSSKVCEVIVRGPEERLICKATFTLFPLKKVEEEDQ